MKNNISIPTGLLRGARFFVVLLLGMLLGLYLLSGFDQLGMVVGAQPRQVTPRGPLAPHEQDIIGLFNEAGPSVVYITTVERRLDFWTRNVLEIPSGTGSGFVWDQQGHIVTNYHVLEGAYSAEVALHDHSVYEAALVGVSPDHDLAVLRIAAPVEKLRPVPLGGSDELQVGQLVFAIGNPFGLDQTLTTGIISALDRTIKSSNELPIKGMIQTDAAINPGNSGGPLLDSAGRLIGVNTAIYSPSGAYAGIGFAVPVNTVNRVVPSLIKHGRYQRPQLGVAIDDQISRVITRKMGIEGLLILNVERGSGAAAAGLLGTRQTRDGRIIPGDVIQRLDANPLADSNDLFSLLDRYRPGDTVTLEIYRKGETLSVEIRLQAP